MSITASNLLKSEIKVTVKLKIITELILDSFRSVTLFYLAPVITGFCALAS